MIVEAPLTSRHHNHHHYHRHHCHQRHHRSHHQHHLHHIIMCQWEHSQVPLFSHHEKKKVHTGTTSDVRVTHEYIRGTYGVHTGKYEYKRVHTGTTSDVRVTHEYIRGTYGKIRVQTSTHGYNE